jgi:hypothetical protein
MELIDDIQIFYFHGFNSGEQSSTFKRIKAAFPNTQMVKYNFMEYGKAYHEIYTFLDSQKKDGTNTIFIGSSLGGYWANLFCSVFGIQTILINPSLKPSESLLKYVGQEFIYNGVTYLFKEENAKGYTDNLFRIYPRVVFIGQKDEVVNYHETEKILGKYAQFIYLVKEGHQLQDIQPILEMIPKLVNTFAG